MLNSLFCDFYAAFVGKVGFAHKTTNMSSISYATAAAVNKEVLMTKEKGLNWKEVEAAKRYVELSGATIQFHVSKN